jgi:hypothetical protein
MPNKQNWISLAHEARMRLLKDKSDSELAKSYYQEGLSEEQFRLELWKEMQLWDPKNIEELKEIKEVPTKDVVLGAWRDLDRSEAIMELIDNSIDAWHKRKQDCPKKFHKQLTVSIDIDAKAGQLTYEDNAGGISVDKLAHLVVPGFSDTDDLSRTIGSYKTGGKKAVFRLASAARIITRYWDPEEKLDETLAVQLDQKWLENLQEYTFPYARIKTNPDIRKGTTRYVLQLRKEDLDPAPWYETPAQLGKVTKQIINAYSLLMIRIPAIKIFFRKKLLKPNPKLYDFTGTKKPGADIRPQQVIFQAKLQHRGKDHHVEIELVLGCRVTTGVKEGKAGGIDLYGNDRLFVSHDQDIFSHLLPTGNSRNLVRGFINIKGPNIFIPWDTHKRHLNEDREIVRRLTKSKLITTIFENWKGVYKAVSRLGSGEVIAFIQAPLKPAVDRHKNDLNIPHRDKVKLDFSSNRGVSLPADVYVPTMPVEKKVEDSHKATLTFTTDEARSVMAYYGMNGEPTQGSMKELADLIKEELLEWVEGPEHG